MQASERASEQRQWRARGSKIFVIYFCAHKIVVLNVCAVGKEVKRVRSR
jgi:hypothetical protein